MARRILKLVIIGVGFIALLTNGHGVALAGAPNPEESGGPSQVSVSGTSGGDFGAMHVVTCSFYAGEPLRYPSRQALEATGAITGCFPNDPNVCRIETDIEIYNTYDNRWELYKDGPNNYPSPCQGGKSKAVSTTCSASTKGYNYRARAYMTIVEDGDSDAQVNTSPVRQYYCL